MNNENRCHCELQQEHGHRYARSGVAMTISKTSVIASSERSAAISNLDIRIFYTTRSSNYIK